MSRVIADALEITENSFIAKITNRYSHIPYPETYEECLSAIKTVERDVDNVADHMQYSILYDMLLYKTWLFYRKTYLLDIDFFNSLAKIKSVRIYPSILKTLAFKTFAVDISGTDLFNGYFLCNYDITDKGIYCSFLSSASDAEKRMKFGVFLDSHDLKTDEAGKQFFTLNSTSDFDSDISIFRDTEKAEKMRNPLKNGILSLSSKKAPVEFKCSEEDIEYYEDCADDYLAGFKSLSEDKRLKVLKRALIQFAYYLCTPEPDIIETGDTKKRKKMALKHSSRLDKVEYCYKAGSRIGAKFRIGKSISDDIGEPVEYLKGTPKCPHVRAAHWSHYYCGPKGEQRLEPRYIEVTFINKDIGDLAEICNEVTETVKRQWKGESLIKRALDALNITYKEQSAVIIDGHRYKFDVGIKQNGQQMYIEYDGEQHFRPVEIFGKEKGYKATRKADLIKNQYCFDNEIPLLRIPYKERGNIDRIVREFLADIPTYSFNAEMSAEYYKTA